MAWRRGFQLLAAVTALALLAGITWTTVAIHNIAPKAGPGDFVALILNPGQDRGWVAQKVRNNERINLLLMARGGEGHDSPDLTDSMLVLSIRPASHRATVISLPRWLWVDVPAPQDGVVQGKLFSAYALGGSEDRTFLRPAWRTATGQGDLAAATVSATIGQPIDGWVVIDLKGFEALIDAVGGVQVTVPETLDDPRYPSDDDDKVIHIHFEAGPQSLDGRRALEYSRSRLSTSELDRARRQEIVLSALFARLHDATFTPASISALGPIKDGLRTDLLPVDAVALRSVLAGLNEANVKRIALEDSNLLRSTVIEEQPVFVPASGSWREVQDYIARELP